ncbi:hypothetical protein [Vibrio phage Va-ZX-1]
MKTYAVYKITCDGSVYIGCTSIPTRQRFALHRNELRKGVHHCKGLQAVYKEGSELRYEELFKFRTSNKTDALMVERYYQELHEDRVNTRTEVIIADKLTILGKKYAKLLKSRTDLIAGKQLRWAQFNEYLRKCKLLISN